MKGFITVKDALLNCDRAKLRDIVREQYDQTDDPEKCVRLTLKFLEQAVKLEPKPEGWISIITVQPEEIVNSEKTITKLNTSSIGFRAKTNENDKGGVSERIIELVASKGIKYLSLIRSISGLTPEDFDGGTYDLCPTDVILAFHIPLETTDTYGMERVLADILYEMTFFGFNIRTNDEEKDAIIDGMIEAIEGAESTD